MFPAPPVTRIFFIRLIDKNWFWSGLNIQKGDWCVKGIWPQNTGLVWRPFRPDQGGFRGREAENTLLLLEILYPGKKFRNQTFRRKTLVSLAISVWLLKFKHFTYKLIPGTMVKRRILTFESVNADTSRAQWPNEGRPEAIRRRLHCNAGDSVHVSQELPRRIFITNANWESDPNSAWQRAPMGVSSYER